MISQPQELVSCNFYWVLPEVPCWALDQLQYLPVLGTLWFSFLSLELLCFIISGPWNILYYFRTLPIHCFLLTYSILSKLSYLLFLLLLQLNEIWRKTLHTIILPFRCKSSLLTDHIFWRHEIVPTRYLLWQEISECFHQVKSEIELFFLLTF
jgi:hypothetical protein